MAHTAPQFLFDFGSPNAFLSHDAIPAIERRIGVRFEYVPVLLGGIFKATNNRSPAETLALASSPSASRYGALAKAWSRSPMISSFGLSGFSVFHAGHWLW